MASTVFNLGAVKLLKKILRFQDSDIQIITGNSADPTVTAIDAVSGSIYIQAGTSNLYIKQDNGSSTNFALTSTSATLANYILSSEKGAANGVATLDSGGKIPSAQLPSTVMDYRGNYNATTNSPSLVDGTGNAGDVYRVNVAGTQNFGSGSQTFAVGDWVVYNGTIWEKSSNSNAVMSVNGLTGVVVLSTTDIAEGSNLYYTAARFNSAFASKSTTDLTEGSNLYYTDGRAQTAVASVGYLKADGSVTITGNLAPNGADNLALGNTNNYFNTVFTSVLVDPTTGLSSISPRNHALYHSGVTAATWSTAGIDLNSHKITSVANPTAAQDAATKNYVDTALAGVGSGTVTNVSSANADISVATGSTTPVLTVNSGTGASQLVKRNASSQIDAATQKIVNVLDPVALQDAATKNYVDVADALKANVTLNNLGSTAINADLLAATDVTTNLGSASKYFLSGYVKNIVTNGNINPDAISTSTPRDIGNTFAFSRIRATRFSPDLTTYTFTGDFTTGSASITNVIGSIPAWLNSSYSVYASGYTTSTGSYTSVALVASFSGTTILMTTASLLTGSGVTFTIVPSLIARSEDQATLNSGNAVIRSGNATTSPSGNTLIVTGTTSTARSGDVIVSTGSASSSGTTGNIVLSPGVTAGTRGSIISQTTMSMSSTKITSLADPTAAQDAATKNYVDTTKEPLHNTTLVQVNNVSLTSNTINEVVTGLTFAFASFNGCSIDYRIAKGTLVRTGKMILATDGTNVAFNDMFVETIDSTIVFDAVVSGANINIRQTNTESGTITFTYQQNKFAV